MNKINVTDARKDMSSFFDSVIHEKPIILKRRKYEAVLAERSLLQMMLEYAKNKLDKKKFEDFYSDVSLIQEKYFDKIIKDVSWFAKKFDYRYDNEPWYDSRDAVERAIKLLSGK